MADIAGYTGEEGTKMDKQDRVGKPVTGTDIVTILCMLVAIITLVILLANLQFGTVG